ncbi:MAG: hypothetical protein ABSG59_08230 [Verrucomicrobiota bacterium]
MTTGESRLSFVLYWLRKAGVFVVVTALFGWFFAEASPRAFPQHQTAGFAYGVLHGALMPLALPSLVMGKDVRIYAANNSGRVYKIGFICGINLCGLLFFGSIFWRPKRGAGDQRNQPQ